MTMTNYSRQICRIARVAVGAIAVFLLVSRAAAHGGVDHGEQSAAETQIHEDQFFSTTKGRIEQFTLANGLRVIVHEDRKAPIVAVRVAYDVGSKQEPPGKTGFAHLFEHLMFKGSENFSGSWTDALNNVGGSGINGTTTNDHTLYYETVPTPALEYVLWLESDRMGYLLAAVTEEALNAERGIVKNEKRERTATADGEAFERMFKGIYPDSHPYHHSIIGSMDDLDDASLEDIHNWFKQYYGPANTVIVLSGDIDANAALPLMEKYFGQIESGQRILKLEARIPERRKSSSRETLQDNSGVSILRILRGWAVPGFATRDSVLLGIAATITGDSPTSGRLYEDLVVKHGVAKTVFGTVLPGELASTFYIVVDVADGVDPADAEEALDKAMAAYLAEGPTEVELNAYKGEFDARNAYLMERVGRKADVLAEAALYAGDAGFVNQREEWTSQASREDVRAAMNTWISSGFSQVTLMPTHYAAADSTIDRSQAPKVDNDLVLKLPEMQETVLSSGIKVVLAERHESPIVHMSLIFENAGTYVDSGVAARTAAMTLRLMGSGPEGMSASAYATRKKLLGLKLDMGAARHYAWSDASILTKNFDTSLSLWEDALRNPAFREQDWERERRGAVDSVERSRQSASGIAHELLSSALYGEGHRDAPQWDQEKVLMSLQTSDFRQFHNDWIRPDNATLFVVGATTLAEIVPQLERVFSDWKSPTSPLQPVAPPLDDVPVASKPRVILVDIPGQEQTTILMGRLVPSTLDKDAQNLNAANSVFGGGLSSRISTNLRVEKGWTYSASSAAAADLVQRNWHVDTSVQTDKTADAVAEIIQEMQAITGSRPVTKEELALFARTETLALPGLIAQGREVLKNMTINFKYGRPYDWMEGKVDRVNALSLTKVNKAAKKYLTPGNMIWVLAGDLAKIEQDIRDLDIGAVEVWNNNGEKIR